MSDHERAELTVADLLAKAAREEWPTSALSVRSHELGPAGRIPAAPSPSKLPCPPPSPPWE